MAARKDMRDRAKTLWIKGMKAIGNTAASIANNTRYKVDEVTIQNRRREVMNDLAVKAYALWLKGEKMPDQMVRMLEELRELDEQLNDMRAEKYALTQKGARPEPAQAGDGGEDEGEDLEEDEDPVIMPAEDSPVSSEINELFDGASSVGKAAEKVNTTLDSMSDRLNSFPQSEDGGDEETEKRRD